MHTRSGSNHISGLARTKLGRRGTLGHGGRPPKTLPGTAVPGDVSAGGGLRRRGLGPLEGAEWAVRVLKRSDYSATWPYSHTCWVCDSDCSSRKSRLLTSHLKHRQHGSPVQPLPAAEEQGYELQSACTSRDRGERSRPHQIRSNSCRAGGNLRSRLWLPLL